MRYLIGAIIVIGILLGVQKLHRYWTETKSQDRPGLSGAYPSSTAPEDAPPAVAAAEGLPALPAPLEASLTAARKQGPDALKLWLGNNRRLVADPRLAAIELDYVVAVAGKNFGEAREVFAAVKSRTPTNSPVYARMKRMERSYQ